MKNSQIIALVIGSCFVTFIASVLFSMNMVTITPKQLANVIEKDTEVFFEAVKNSFKDAEKRQVEKKRESAQKAMEEQFKNPLEIKTKGRVTFGDSKAPVTIVEFSDFQCPYCSKAAENMSALRKKYDGKVSLVYKHFPLSFHPFAKPAAEYFEAVALISHDKAREFHDEIFYNFDDYARLNNEKEINTGIKNILKKIGLNMSKVEANLKKAKKVVQADMDEASKLGVGGTPSFFVNGIDAKGVNIEMIIDRILGKGNEEEEEEEEDNKDDK